MERINLDDYFSDDYDEYLSDNMESTPMVITEVKASIKQDPPLAPPHVTVTVQLEDKPVAEDFYKRRRVSNQKRAFRCQRVADRRQEQQGDNYDYSNSDLCNVINIGHDARNVIISRIKKREEIEACSPSSNYRIPKDRPGSSKKRKHVNADSQGGSREQHRAEAPPGGNRIDKMLQRKRWLHPKSSHTTFECNSLRKALGAPLMPNSLPRV